MSICPVCSAELDEDFGVAQCPQCGTSLMIDFDGGVQLSDSSGAENESPGYEEESFDAKSESTQYEEDSLTFESQSPEYVEEEFTSDSDDVFNSANELNTDSGLDSGAAAEPSIHLSPPEELLVPVEPDQSPHLQSISQFGNEKQNSTDESPYRYNIYISAIDGAERREALRQVLADEKFLWDSEVFMGKIKEGTLVLEEVSPIKAQVLILQLKGFGFEIYWKQLDIHTK